LEALDGSSQEHWPRKEREQRIENKRSKIIQLSLAGSKESSSEKREIRIGGLLSSPPDSARHQGCQEVIVSVISVSSRGSKMIQG
jgi:hypothetical protein